MELSSWRKLKGKAPTFHACYFVATEDIIKNRFILDKTNFKLQCIPLQLNMKSVDPVETFRSRDEYLTSQKFQGFLTLF